MIKIKFLNGEERIVEGVLPCPPANNCLVYIKKGMLIFHTGVKWAIPINQGRI